MPARIQLKGFRRSSREENKTQRLGQGAMALWSPGPQVNMVLPGYSGCIPLLQK